MQKIKPQTRSALFEYGGLLLHSDPRSWWTSRYPCIFRSVVTKEKHNENIITIFTLDSEIYVYILNVVYFNSLSIFSFTSFIFNCLLSLAVESACLIVPCVSLYRWVHFSRAVLLYLQVASHLIQRLSSYQTWHLIQRPLTRSSFANKTKCP